LSLRGLAARCGVDVSYLTRLKNGDYRHPREDVLKRLAQVLDQDVEDYHLALLADRGELPSWGKVLGNELGIRLNTEDKRAIEQFVEVMLKDRRGS
jgi:transcriptional regulator with XRE-family HTH domain